MAITRTTLTGTYHLFDGSPAVGHVEIIPSVPVVKDTADNVILSGRVKVDLDAEGKFSIDLPATDDPNLNPTGFGYTVAAKLRHHHPRAVSFALPGGPPVDIEDVTPVDPATFTPTTTYLEPEDLEPLDARVTVLEERPVVASWDDLPDKPTIPATAADVGAEPAGSVAALDAGLAPVAKSGAYGDLSGRPAIPTTAADIGAETPAGATAKAAAAAAPKLNAADLDATTAAKVNDPASQTRAALSATFAEVVTPEKYGAKGDGTTDDTAAVQAALNAIQAAEGGTLYLAPGKTYRCDGQLTHPGGYVRITSAGGSLRDFEGFTSAPITTGPILDLRYGGADAKFLAMKKGTLEIDHITLSDFGTSSTPYLLFTYTQPRIHDAAFQGNGSKYRGTCDQDAIVLGGLSNAARSQDNPNSGFAGYGGYVCGNDFKRIRRAVHARNYVNNIIFDGNAIDPSCGSNITVDAPFVFDSGGSDGALKNHVQGNIISNNTIELTSDYAHGVILRNNAQRNVIRGNGFWDKQPGKFVSDVLCDEATNCRKNAIIMDGYSNTYLISGITVSNGYNYVWQPGEEWATQTAERKPAGWKMFLYGTDVYHYMDLNLARNAARIAAWYGLEVRSSDTNTSFMLRSSAASPNGSAKANPGDVCAWPSGAAGAKLWVKEGGANDTNLGWTPLGSSQALTIKNTSHTAVESDQVIVMGGTGSGLTLTLPDPSSVHPGRQFRVKNVNANTVTLQSAGTSKTIDGAATMALAQWARVLLFSDGTAWFTL